MDKQKPEIVVISSLDNSGIKSLSISIRASILDPKKRDVAMISADTYL